MSTTDTQYLTMFQIGLLIQLMATVLQHRPAMRPITKASPTRATELTKFGVDDQLLDDEQAEKSADQQLSVLRHASEESHREGQRRVRSPEVGCKLDIGLYVKA
jgi:hypothetical protein